MEGIVKALGEALWSLRCSLQESQKNLKMKWLLFWNREDYFQDSLEKLKGNERKQKLLDHALSSSNQGNDTGLDINPEQEYSSFYMMQECIKEMIWSQKKKMKVKVEST